MTIDELIDALTALKVHKQATGDAKVYVFDRWKDEIYEVEDVQVDENGGKVIL